MNITKFISLLPHVANMSVFRT